MDAYIPHIQLISNLNGQKEETIHLEDAGVHWRLILKLNKNKQTGRVFTGFRNY